MTSSTQLLRDLRKVERFIVAKKVGVVKDPANYYEHDDKGNRCAACLLGMRRLALTLEPDERDVTGTPLLKAMHDLYPDEDENTISRLGRRAFLRIVRYAIREAEKQ